MDVAWGWGQPPPPPVEYTRQYADSPARKKDNKKAKNNKDSSYSDTYYSDYDSIETAALSLSNSSSQRIQETPKKEKISDFSESKTEKEDEIALSKVKEKSTVKSTTNNKHQNSTSDDEISFSDKKETTENETSWWKKEETNRFCPRTRKQEKKFESEENSESSEIEETHSNHKKEREGEEYSDNTKETPEKSKSNNKKEESDQSKEEKNEKNFILRDRKAPLIWTIGHMVMSGLVLGCMIYQVRGKFQKIKVNPFFGFDEATIISFGAKLGIKLVNGEWWRLVIANFVNAGIIQFVVTIIATSLCYLVEVLHGFFTAMLTFLLGGSFGYILSSIMTPTYTQCGSNGAICCWIGFRLSRIFVGWSAFNNYYWIAIYIVDLIVIAAMGLLPYNDNFCNIGGLIMGVLVGLILMPNVEATKCITVCRTVTALLSFPVMATTFCLCLVFFSRKIGNTEWCEWCKKVICVDFSTTKWCPKPFY